MNQQPTRTGQTGNWPEELDQYLYQFEQAWQSGTAPEIDQFLASLEDQWKNWDQTTRGKLLEELIKLDLEFRWRQLHQAGGITADMAEQDTLVAGADESKRWFLEDYVRQHPQLGSSGKLSLELVLEEYRVRQLWGDSPSHQEYVKRFPDHGQDLPERLAQIDSDLPDQADTASSQQTASSTVAAEPLASGRFGDYELLGEIARGGMGVVYRARQISLDRTVAVKMILSGQLASEEDVRRFRTEAESAARLQHPHIVTIHEVGELKGQHYFSMDFIEGESLSDRVSDGPLAPEAAAELVSKVAAAIDYAHQQGILHRDLKPQNILIDSSQEPQITDFGLAKRIEGQSDLTGTGQILGTPSYMPPEQAGSDPSAVGPASDIYSLGAILYELVTGRPPFQAQTPLDTLMQVLSQEPVSPRLLNASVPRDLETIILKCLQKQPAKRYASAAELSEELGRYLEGKLITARPVGAWERGWRWCRRKPALAGMWALAAVLLLTLSIGGPLVALQQRESARQQRENVRKQALLLERARKAQLAEVKQRKEADRQKDIAETKQKEAETAKKEAETQKGIAEAKQEEAEREYYYNVIATAHDKIASGDFQQAEAMLWVTPQKQRGWEWGRLMHLCHLDLWTLKSIDFGEKTSPINNQFQAKAFNFGLNSMMGTNAMNAPGYQWDAASPSLTTFLSPNGQWIVTNGEEGTKIWEISEGEQVLRLVGTEVFGETGPIAFIPPAVSAVFSRDSRRLMLRTGSGVQAIWDLATKRKLVTLKGQVFQGVSADGQWLLADDRQKKKTVIWDLNSGKPVLSLKDQDRRQQARSSVRPQPQPSQFQVRQSNLGDIISDGFAGTGGMGPMMGAMSFAGGIYTGVAFSDDGRRLVTSDYLDRDYTTRIWDVQSGNELAATKAHQFRVDTAAFTPDGQRVATADRQETILREVPGGKEMYRLKDALFKTFSHDGEFLVTVGSGAAGTTVWKTESGSKQITLNNETYLSLSHDSKKIATMGIAGLIRIWDLQTGAVLRTLKGHEHVNAVAFSHDGRRLLTLSQDMTVKCWDVRVDREELTTATGIDQVLANERLRFRIRSGDKTARVFDAFTDQLLVTLKGYQGHVRAADVSPNGEYLVTTNGDRLARIWKVSDGQLLFDLKGHDNNISLVSFSPDGRRVLTASSYGSAIVWDTSSGRKLVTVNDIGNMTPLGYSIYTGTMTPLGFSADGRRLVRWMSSPSQSDVGKKIASENSRSGGMKLGDDGVPVEAKVWDANNGKSLLSQSFPHLNPYLLKGLVFSPDGRWLAVQYSNEGGSMGKFGKGKGARPGAGIGKKGGTVNSKGPAATKVPAGKPGLHIFDTTNGKLLRTFTTESLVAFAPGSQFVVTTPMLGQRQSQKPELRIRKTADWEIVMSVKGHTLFASSTWFSPGNKRLLLKPNGTNNVVVWDISGKQKVLTLKGHGGPVSNASYSPDGRRIVTTCGDDQTTRIWDAANGRELLVLRGPGSSFHSWFSPGGRHLMSGGLGLGSRQLPTVDWTLKEEEFERKKQLAFQAWLRMLQQDRISFSRTKELAEAGDSQAQYEIGIEYLENRPSAEDYRLAFSWLERSAAKSYADAARALTVGRARMPIEIVRHFALEGDIELQLQLAGHYFGKGEFEQAVTWFQRAAVAGKTDAQIYLGRMYYQGQGVDRDFSMAARWYQKAAEHGNNMSLIELAHFFADQQNPLKDDIQAYKWALIAIDVGHFALPVARQVIAGLNRKMTPEQIAGAEKLAREWVSEFAARKKKPVTPDK